MEPKAEGGEHAARGRRFSPAERAVILKDASELGVGKAAEKHRCSPWSIYDWRRKERQAMGIDQWR